MSNKQLRTRLSSWEQRGDLLRQKKMAVDLDFRMRWWWSGYVPSGACHSGLDQRPSSAAQKVFVWLSELRGAASQHGLSSCYHAWPWHPCVSLPGPVHACGAYGCGGNLNKCT